MEGIPIRRLKRMYEHLVVFKLKPETPYERLQELVEKLLAFRGQIPGMKALSAGINVTEETDNAHGYGIGLRITFQDQESLRAYGPHPVHQEFVRSLDGLVENVVVVDYPVV